MRQAEKKLLIILDCCVGCHACEIACRQEHDLTDTTDAKRCRVITSKPRRVQGELHLDFFPTMCVQCEDPLCCQFCVQDAIGRREDGIVVVEKEKCTGCQTCVWACPWGAMSFNHETRVAAKCDLCLERIEFGIEPSCVQHCIGGALRYVTEEELRSITRGKHTLRVGRLTYASSKWKFAQGLWPRSKDWSSDIY